MSYKRGCNIKPTVDAVLPTPDGRTVITSGGAEIVIWNVASREPVYRLTDLADYDSQRHWDHLALTSDGRYLFGAGRGEVDIYCWDLERRERIPRKGQDNTGVYGIALTPDGKQLVAGWEPMPGADDRRFDRRLKVYSVDGFLNKGFYGKLTNLGRKPHGRFKTLPDVLTYTEIENNLENPEYLALSPDGKWLAVGCGFDGTTTVWNFETQEVQCVLRNHYSGALTFTHDSKYLIVAHQTMDEMGVFDIVSKEFPFSFLSGAGPDDGYYVIGKDVTTISLSSDGRLLAATSPNKYIRIWRWDKPEEVETVHTVDAAMRCCTFIPGRYLLVSGDDFGNVHFMDLKGI